ncbi:MAG: double zinc ribbon domain-containing protein [Ignavibacteriaceae bacterium]
MEKRETDKFKLCLKCGNFCSINEDQIFCVVCGDKMTEKCKNCEAPIIYPTGKFCHKCGTAYEAKPDKRF